VEIKHLEGRSKGVLKTLEEKQEAQDINEEKRRQMDTQKIQLRMAPELSGGTVQGREGRNHGILPMWSPE
jgi:hypothetical protein